MRSSCSSPRDRSRSAPPIPTRGRRRRAALILAVVLAGGAVACATAGASKVQGDLDAIQQQLWKMQKDNAALLDQLTALRAQPVPAGGGAGAATETRLRIEAVERDLRAMQARSEEVDLRLAALIADLRSTREAVETLRRQAAVPAAGSTVVVPAAAGPAGGSPVGTEDAAAYPAQIPPAVGGPSGPVTTPAGAGEELYRQARADFDQGNYALALQETQEFLDRYPDHPRIGEALYLVGEIHLGQRQYSQAVAAYDVLLKSPAAGDRIPAGHYKKGLALLELNRTADAVIQLQHVVTAYPRTEEARMARERLQALGLKER